MSVDNIRQAFIADIIDNPCDDVPRLIYADWLQDHGDEPCGEFIRASLAWEKVVEQKKNSTQRRRRSRAWHELFLAFQRVRMPNNFTHMADIGHPYRIVAILRDEPMPVRRLLFRRGFVAEAVVTPDNWLKYGPAISRANPVECVKPVGRRPYLRTFPHDYPYPNCAGKSFWQWRCECDGHLPTWRHLPRSIFTRLEGYVAPGGLSLKQYLTEEDAEVAASRACIAWARSIKCVLCNDKGIVLGESRTPCLCTVGPKSGTGARRPLGATFTLGPR